MQDNRGLKGGDKFATSASFRRKPESSTTWAWKPSLAYTSWQASGTARSISASLAIPSTWQHKEGLVRGFTKKYGVHRLVYIELHDTMPAAIQREKQMKEWKRAWKLELIESVNPEWRDLYEDIWR
jgi:putative endonuclease